MSQKCPEMSEDVLFFANCPLSPLTLDRRVEEMIKVERHSDSWLRDSGVWGRDQKNLRPLYKGPAGERIGRVLEKSANFFEIFFGLRGWMGVLKRLGTWRLKSPRRGVTPDHLKGAAI
jgi:hypothetical protein